MRRKGLATEFLALLSPDERDEIAPLSQWVQALRLGPHVLGEPLNVAAKFRDEPSTAISQPAPRPPVPHSVEAVEVSCS